MIKQILPLSSIIALRFLGLFIVMPVLSVYALGLEGADEVLAGVVIGGYALTQMLLQLPFGILSDRIGRKQTLLIGLLIFAAGSVVCALSGDIYMLMFGRFLQGAGAIGAVVTAMISDSVKEEVRAKAMAVMGGSIAVSFAVAMLAGPVIGTHYGVDKLFWITAFLALAAIAILFTKVPAPPVISHDYEQEKLGVILKNRDLMKMNVTHFLQKGFMTIAFLVIPLILTQEHGWEKTELYKVYLPAMLFGLLAMGPAAVLGEKRNRYKEIFVFSITLFGIAFLLMLLGGGGALFIVGVVLFFVAFNMFEPLMQSLTTKFAKVHQKGAALGVANSFAYFGTFIGGLFGGMILRDFGFDTLVYLLLAISVAWALVTLSMTNPAKMRNLYLPKNEAANLTALEGKEGICEYYTNETEGVAIIKYETEKFDEESIKSIVA